LFHQYIKDIGENRDIQKKEGCHHSVRFFRNNQWF
jgi:hypothetical protein